MLGCQEGRQGTAVWVSLKRLGCYCASVIPIMGPTLCPWNWEKMYWSLSETSGASHSRRGWHGGLLDRLAQRWGSEDSTASEWVQIHEWISTGWPSSHTQGSVPGSKCIYKCLAPRDYFNDCIKLSLILETSVWLCLFLFSFLILSCMNGGRPCWGNCVTKQLATVPFCGSLNEEWWLYPAAGHFSFWCRFIEDWLDLESRWRVKIPAESPCLCLEVRCTGDLHISYRQCLQDHWAKRSGATWILAKSRWYWPVT